MNFYSPIPILRSFDEIKAKEFYVAFLGFSIDWEHRFEDNTPLYMQLSKDGCIIHLSELHGDSSPGASLRISTNNLDSYQRALKEKNIRIPARKFKTCHGVLVISLYQIPSVTSLYLMKKKVLNKVILPGW